MSALDELLTVHEVAEHLKVNPQTVRNWIDRGELASVRIGSRRVRIRRPDLEAFISTGSKVMANNATGSMRHAETSTRPLGGRKTLVATKFWPMRCVELARAATGLAKALKHP
jgi:excisionase family DNA binding protein